VFGERHLDLRGAERNGTEKNENGEANKGADRSGKVFHGGLPMKDKSVKKVTVQYTLTGEKTSRKLLFSHIKNAGKDCQR
jgi:hypothetical protein